RFRAHPQLRLLGQPQAYHHVAALLSVAGLSTRTAHRTKRLLHQRLQRPLALPKVWRTDGGRRKTYGCGNPTSFSTAHRRRMRLPSTSRRVRVPCHAHCFCVFWRKLSLLLPPHASPLPADGPRQRSFLSLRPPSCPAAHPRHTCTPASSIIHSPLVPRPP